MSEGQQFHVQSTIVGSYSGLPVANEIAEFMLATGGREATVSGFGY